jgi:hypothetical protein
MEVQLPEVHPAFFIVVRLFAQRWRQAQQELMGGNAPWLGLAPHQLAQGECAAPAQQFVAPFVVQAPTFVQDEKNLEAGIAKQHVRRLLPGGVKLFGAVRHIQAL